MRAGTIAGLLLVSAVASIHAQSLTGRVLGPSGGLPDALVILHDSTGERARVQTSGSGGFSFALEPGEVPVFLLVRAIGFTPQSYRLSRSLEQAVAITMVPFALPLPELAVRAVRDRCPNRPQISANRVWEAARTRYVLPRPTQGIEFYGRLLKETVGEEQIGTFDEQRLQPGKMGRAGMIRAPAADAINHSIYARKLDGDLDLLLSVVKGDDSYALWWYPALESWEVDHWLQPSFQANHVLSQVTQQDGTIDIIFCPIGNKKPSFSGALTLGPDTTLRSATWTFITEKPEENAGGRVDFLPVHGGSVSFLQPTLGVFWRRLVGSKRYVQRAMSFSQMRISPDQRIPGH